MKKLNDILFNESKSNLDFSVSDNALEQLLSEADNKEKPLDSDGDIGLVLARLSDMISMADDLYDTASGLEDIDKETEDRVNEVYTALDELYVMFDDKFDIAISDFDTDGIDMEEALGIKLDDILKEDEEFIIEKFSSSVFKMLKKIGFSQAPADTTESKNKKIKPIELYGLEMRSGKWADVWVGQDSKGRFFFDDSSDITFFKSESELAQQLKIMALGESISNFKLEGKLVESLDEDKYSDLDLTFTEESGKKKENVKEAKELLGFKLDTPIDLEVEKVSFKFKTSTGKLPSPALQKSLSRYYITFKGFSSSPRQEVKVGEEEAKAFKVDRLKPGKKVRAIIGADVYDRLILKKII